MCNHFFDLYLYVLTREILYSSCVFYFNGNRNELINLRSQFYVKITSVCVTDSFLVRYVRNMTYHENKKNSLCSRRNNFWIFLSSHLEEIMVVLPVWQTIHVERLVEEAPESRVRQGAHV